VRRGDTLVEIDSGDAGAAAAELREAQSLLSLAEERFERSRQLREQGIASEKDFRQASQEQESARIRLETARAQASRLGVATDTAGGVLRLRAPADGTVLFLHAVGGEPARPDEVMATVGDIATVWIWADLYERDLSRLAAGPLPAEVSVRAWPGQAFAGTVDFVSPSIDEASRTVKLRVTVPNPDGRLLAGMFAAVQVFLPGDQEALVLPRLAVMEDEGRSFVFVHHHDDFYVRRPVTTGRTWGDRTEITEGLNGDEIIVADGAFLMKSDVLRSKMGAGCAD
jgi:cobalt-zinc-cadmium efflux system membrane fusion protein